MTPNRTIADEPPETDAETTARQRWMAVLARASATEIRLLLEKCPALPAWRKLRGPETGLVMVRGRAGGGGAPFNLGEMTVTRCSIRTDAGSVGHAYVAGRDHEVATLAAVIDAFLQEPPLAATLRERVIAPLAQAQQDRRETTSRKAAATQVQFFTLANMRA